MSEKHGNATLARQIRTARQDLGLTQAELAEQVGCPCATLAAWEQGYRTPGLLKALALQRVLKIQIRME